VVGVREAGGGKGVVSRLDYDRVASILVEAAFFGDPQASQRWGITERTIRNYRAKLDEDSELSSFFLVKKQAFESEWATEIPMAIRAGIHFLGEAAKKANPTDPDTIHAIAGAVKILAEVGLTKEIIDARLGRYDREDGAQGQPLASVPSSTDE
jgi:hypothetical protein